MNAMTYDWQGKRYARISKAAARAAYGRNQTVFVQSVKYIPFGGWQQAYAIKKADIDAQQDGWTFDRLVDNWQSYNADWERGYYPSFWVRRV